MNAERVTLTKSDPIYVQLDDERVVEELEKLRAKEAKRKKKDKKKKKKRLTAKTADRHKLYQRSVQSPEDDLDFLEHVYKDRNDGKMPVHFREDFCGTAYLASTWVKRRPENTAEGYDLDPNPVAWGLEHNWNKLGSAGARAHIFLKDVRERSQNPPDVRSAQNFSWFVFKERAQLVDYFRAVFDDLPDHGVFVMDIQGGPESQEVMEEETDHDDFTYVWDQDEYWPGTGDYLTKIHFRFNDGTEMTDAFVYDWRLWNLTEAIDALREVGFGNVESWWEGTDEDGESGNGEYTQDVKGENCQAWVTYIVASK